jgi:hypothetical protein
MTVTEERTPMELLSLRRSEYENLRQEIVKRVELSHSFINLTVVATGAVVGIAGATDSSRVLLLFPLLPAALCYVWGSNLLRLAELGTYVRHLEHKHPHLQIHWETHLERLRSAKWTSRWADSALGFIFPGTQIVAVWAGFDRLGSGFHLWNVASMLLMAEAALVLLTVLIIIRTQHLFESKRHQPVRMRPGGARSLSTTWRVASSSSTRGILLGSRAEAALVHHCGR